jgi:hypothetical protein
MDIINEIRKDITTLKTLVNSPDLPSRLELADRIAINNFYLADMVAEAYEASAMAEYLWKSSVEADKATSTEGIGKAESKAKHSHRELYETAVKADALHKRYDLLFKSAIGIVEQMRSSNSHLKKEYGSR